MTLYEMTKKYSSGKGVDTMWKTVEVISRAVESGMPADQKEKLMRDVYNIISTGHYNEDFAHEDVAKMYYVDKNGDKHQAPYWTDSAVRAIYDSVSDEIPDYNEWDFYVVMNMRKSDDWCMLAKWFPNATDEEMNQKIVDDAMNWLNDEDWPTKTKVWDYLSDR